MAELFAALVERVEGSETLLVVDRSPPRETESPSITVGAERGEEEPRLSVTLDPDGEQAVFRGVYWRSGQFTPDMREKHGLLFPPAVFRIEGETYGLGDPRQGGSQGSDAEVERYGSAGEAAGMLFALLEEFYGMVEERSA